MKPLKDRKFFRYRRKRAAPKGGMERVALKGDMTGERALTLYKQLDELSEAGVGEVVLDFSGLEHFDSVSLAIISLMEERYEKEGMKLRVESLNDSQKEALEMMPASHPGFGKEAARDGLIASMGEWGLSSGRDLAQYMRFCAQMGVEAARVVFTKNRYAKGELVKQCVTIGVDAFPIIALSSLLMGSVLGFQAAAQMADFGGVEYMANLVGVGMCTEFGPLMTAIVLAGRSGSAIAAELGTMKVQEELDALRVMGLDPERYLVVPKMFAILLMGPSLTLLSMMLGIFGGLLIGVLYVDMSVLFYIYRTVDAVQPGEVWHGLWKSEVFAFLIGSIASYCGMQIEGGASGVGKATTRAVVMGIFMIIFADSVATGLSTMARGWFQ